MEPAVDHYGILKKEGIAVQAYSPLIQGQKLGNSIIARIAKKHGKTAAQVMLRWVLQQGMITYTSLENC